MTNEFNKRSGAWAALFAALGLTLAAGCSPREPAAVEARSSALLSSSSLELDVLTNICAANQAQDFFQVVNNTTAGVKLSDITIKLWVDDTSGSAVVPHVWTGGCLTNATGCFHQVSGVTAAATSFTPACGPDPTHQANWEITISNTDSTVLAPGVTWANIQSALNLANYSNFAPGTADWFSPCLTRTSYAPDPHFAVYTQGNLVFSSGISTPSCRSPHGQQQLAGNYVTSQIAAAPVVGPVPGTTPISLSIGLPVRVPTSGPTLTQLAHNVADPTNSSFRQYITPDQFAATYSPTSTDYATLVSFAQAHGLTITQSHGDRLLLDVQAPAATIERTFYVNLKLALRPDGTQFYALDRQPSLDLSLPIQWISGFDNFNPGQRQSGGTGPLGGYQSSDLRSAYASCASTLTGAGQRLGLIAFANFDPADPADYEALNSPQLPAVPIGTVPTGNFSVPVNCGTDNDCLGASQEVNMDIDMAMAMAPGLLRITVFQGNNCNDFDSALSNVASTLPLHLTVSSSWLCSIGGNTGNLFAKLAVQGQSMALPSGDEGGYPSDQGFDLDLDNVTIVGGTVLTLNGSPPTYGSEVSWREGGGSGGGILTTASIPDYQKGIDMSKNGGSTTARNAPDVAMVATNVFVVWPGKKATLGPGTSVSSPLWAGFLALANEQSIAAGHGSLGFVNPTLYAILKNASLYATSFNDIVDNTTGKFQAVKGYDLVTGIGSPTCRLIAQLASGTPTVPISTGIANISAGGHHTCVTRSLDGTIDCFGENESGEIGDGVTGGVATKAFAVSGLSGALAVSAGVSHSCAVFPLGNVECWGDNSFGELGDGTHTSSPTPVAVIDPVFHAPSFTATQVAAGLRHTCALVNGGGVQCWGDNTLGELGDGTHTSGNTFVKNITTATNVGVGTGHSCAVASGKVWCWGDNTLGQLGNGSTTSSPNPVTVQGLPDPNTNPPRAVVAGLGHSCAILQDGSVYCWGQNQLGQLGNQTTTASTKAVAVLASLGLPAVFPEPILAAAISSAANANHTCASFGGGGGAVCWGDNSDAQLANGGGGSSNPQFPAFSDDATLPVISGTEQIPNLVGQLVTVNVPLTGVASIAVGAVHTCAAMTDGTVLCWGDNVQGELGTFTGSLSPLPVPIPLP
jgi:alpha-tubulin suppressor-like RCC1 family protein